MNIAKIVSLVCILAMSAALVFGFTVGDFAADGAKILSNPWGIVSIVDLYVGFILFSGWIIYREESKLKAFIWVVFMMVLGFFTGAVYTYLALNQSGGEWRKFWLGVHAQTNTESV